MKYTASIVPTPSAIPSATPHGEIGTAAVAYWPSPTPSSAPAAEFPYYGYAAYLALVIVVLSVGTLIAGFVRSRRS